MQTAQQSPREPLGPEGEPCAECGAPLAADQRYCVNCGRRRGEPRVAPPPATAARAADGGRPNDVSPLAAVIGVALLGGMLLIGVLIGRGNSDSEQSPPATIQVGEGTATTATPNAGAPGEGAQVGSGIATDWPAGTTGFTVQVATVPKSGATPDNVAAARSAAEAQGADQLGVLDSDLYPSLTAGNYVIYSGVFDKREDASAHLGELGSAAAGAEVIEVSDGS